MDELPDTAEAMEAKETARRLPLGWVILFWGLIAWGLAYFWLYQPSLGGWSQEKAYQESLPQAEKK